MTRTTRFIIFPHHPVCGARRVRRRHLHERARDRPGLRGRRGDNPEGLTPGDGDENVVDGWTITYDRWLVAIGGFAASRSDAPGAALSAPDTYILDLKNAPTTGYVITEWKDAEATRWDKFGFSIPNATASAKPLAPTSQVDATFMSQNGYSVYFEGAAEKGTDRITFKWGFRAGTAFADCATRIERRASRSRRAAPSSSSPRSTAITIFTNITEGAEITERRAEWMKVCDADVNGDLTLVELAACDAAIALPQAPTGPYDLAGDEDQDADGKLTVYDYVASQMRTLGDFQGDGECPTRTKLP